MSKEITVLIPSSVIPSHPDTAIIDQTIASVRERLPDSEIIIMFDGVRSEQVERKADYDQYVATMLHKTRDDISITPLVFPHLTHQAEMTRQALKLVTTPTILYVEHDTPLIGDIDEHEWDYLVGAVTTGPLNLMRFSHEAVIPEPHWPLMLDKKPTNYYACEDCCVPIIRTVQWSQRPHLARTEFYRWILHEYFAPGEIGFIEDKMYGIVYNEYRENGLAGWEKFRLAIYAPDPDNLKRSDNLDGRATDKKYEGVGS